MQKLAAIQIRFLGTRSFVCSIVKIIACLIASHSGWRSLQWSSPCGLAPGTCCFLCRRRNIHREFLVTGIELAESRWGERLCNGKVPAWVTLRIHDRALSDEDTLAFHNGNSNPRKIMCDLPELWFYSKKLKAEFLCNVSAGKTEPRGSGTELRSSGLLPGLCSQLLQCG
jgi:hypothetical protein